MFPIRTQLRAGVIALSLAIALALKTMPNAAAQVAAVGGCDTYSPSSDDTVTCDTDKAIQANQGIQTPENNKDINNVTVTVAEGVVLNVNGSTIGLGSGSTVINSGTLFTRSFRFGYGISAGVNGRSTAGGNTITNKESGRILTDGSDAHGIYINARESRAAGNTITNKGRITTTGNRADGIRLFTTTTLNVDNKIINSSGARITTQGSDAHGIHVFNTQGLVDVISEGDITVTGTGSHAIYIDGSANLTLGGVISAPLAAVFVDPDSRNTSPTTLTLLNGVNITGDIRLSTTRNQEVLEFKGFQGVFNNPIFGANTIKATESADVTLTAAQYSYGAGTIEVGDDSRLLMLGEITDASVTKDGSGRFVLGSASRLSQVTVNEGSFETAGDGFLRSNAHLDIDNEATFLLGGDQGLSSLTGEGTLNLSKHQIDLNLQTAQTFSGAILGDGGRLRVEGAPLTLDGNSRTVAADSVTILEGKKLVKVFDTTLILDSPDALGIYTTVELFNNATLEVTKPNTVLGAVILEDGAAAPGADIVGAGSVAPLLTVVTAGEIDAVISDPTIDTVTYKAGLIKTSGGTASITKVEAYTGITAVRAGRLELTGVGELSSESSLIMYEGGTFALNPDKDQTFLSLAGAGGTIELNGSELTVDGDRNTSFGGTITGAGSFVKDGEGTLRLAGNNTYTGGTTIGLGTLIVANANALGSGDITFTAATGSNPDDGRILRADLDLTFDQPVGFDLVDSGAIDTQDHQVTIAGVIEGGGQLAKHGEGLLRLSGDNADFSGGVKVEAGTLALGADEAAGSGDIVMSGDTTILADTNLTLANTIKLGGPVVFDTQSHNVVLNAAVTNNSVGSLVKTGSGRLTLNKNSDYSGGSTIQEGTLEVNAELTSNVTVQSGASLGGSGTITGNVTNAGTIQPRLNGTRNTLTIEGDYEGTNGRFASTLGGSTDAIEADQLAITGVGNSASGTTTITVSDPIGVLGQPTTGDGILLVDVSGGATSTASAFNAPRIAAGAYEYTLVQGGETSEDSWYLRADIDEPPPPVVITPEVAQRKEVALYPVLPTMVRQYLWSINGTRDDRRGLFIEEGTWDEENRAWARFVAQGNKHRPGDVNKGPGVSSNDWGLQLGGDIWRGESDATYWRLGPVVTLGQSRGDAYNTSGEVKTGSLSFDAYSVGLNATITQVDGPYVDLMWMRTQLSNVTANSVLGAGLETSGWASSGSVELGWEMNRDGAFSITPQLQWFFSDISLKNTTDEFALIEKPQFSTNLGRLGIKFASNEPSVGASALQWWVRADVYSVLDGGTATTSFANLVGTNPTEFSSQIPNTWFGADAALSWSASERVQLQGGLGFQSTFDGRYRAVSGQVSARFAF